MTPSSAPRIAYVMKRYPRLTETFILNEIMMMERLGARLELFSLLQPEPPPHHPMVAEIAAPVRHLPPTWPGKAATVLKAHLARLTGSPLRYLRAAACAARTSLRSGRPIDTWKQFLRAGYVADRCRRSDVTLIHGHFANTPTQVAWFASEMTGIPFSFTAHAKDLYLTPASELRAHARAAAFVTTCTQYNADFFRELLPARDRGKVHRVYHGIDLGRLAERAAPPGRSDGAPLILSVGRLVPKKGLGDLVAACQILKQAGIRFRCAIVGEGPLRQELQSDIERRGLIGWVALPGSMTHADLIALYGEASAFALTPCIVANGDRDGIPNVLAEAMAIGVPVVSTSVSGIPELVEHGVTGLLVPPQAPAEIAARLSDLLGDPELGAGLAREARLRLAGQFDCSETTKALRELMQACACGGDHGRSLARSSGALAGAAIQTVRSAR